MGGANHPIRPDRRSMWLWPLRPSASISRSIWYVATYGQRVTANGRWVIASIAIGIAPLLVGYWFGLWQTQLLTGLLLAMVLLPSVIADRFFRAAAVVALTIAAHSIVAIVLSALDPQGASQTLKGSSEYWEQTWRWVQRGDDQEYNSGVWLPTHLALLLAVPMTAYTSFGFLPLARGVQELDLMNYYVGQLIRVSERPDVAVLLGWHPWSFLRGLAYTFLIFEAMSWSLERMSSRTLTTRRRRRVRLACGLLLAVLDALAKFYLAPVIQQLLNANLKPEFRAVSIP